MHATHRRNSICSQYGSAGSVRRRAFLDAEKREHEHLDRSIESVLSEQDETTAALRTRRGRRYVNLVAKIFFRRVHSSYVVGRRAWTRVVRVCLCG